jgi:hypothetical protein
MTYIHYGHKSFNRDKFQSIENRPYFNKPMGGLWASPVEGANNWKDWCEKEQFRDCSESESFKFKLKDNANVLHLRSCDDLENIEQLKDAITQLMCNKAYPNFEHLLQDGIDAIEYHLSNDWDLYWAMYGWDCDSILVMNPDVIEIVNE